MRNSDEINDSSSTCEIISNKPSPNDASAAVSTEINELLYTISTRPTRTSTVCCVLLFATTVSLMNLVVPKRNQLPGSRMETLEQSSAVPSFSTLFAPALEPSFEPSFAPSSLPHNMVLLRGWSEVKLVVYMTSHLPDHHLAFLPCWKDAVERLPIFKYADLLLYTSANPTNKQLQFLPFRTVTIKKYTSRGYQDHPSHGRSIS